MSKDNENVLLPALNVDVLSESVKPQPFTPDQLISCEACSRVNPPTKTACLYCGAALPVTAATIHQQKPVLRPLEKWEQGYNIIVQPSTANQLDALSEAALSEASDVLKLSKPDLVKIISRSTPFPLARAANSEEAALVQRRLGPFEIETCVVPDRVLNSPELLPLRIRKIALDDAGFTAFQNAGSTGIPILWDEIVLFVVGRLITKRVELREQRVSRSENRIVDSSEYYDDESALDIYSGTQKTAFRVAAKSFDFSCLADAKVLLAEENFTSLVNLFRERAPQAVYDDCYNQLRKLLETIWPSEQENASAGWRHSGPGKYSMDSATAMSNETQFLKYSRLRYHFHFESLKA